MSDLAGVVLAAGAGTRLAPLTRLRPKALCPVANRPLLDHALDRLAAVVPDGSTAVNLHHGAAMVDAHLDAGERPVHRSVEQPTALGTAGALGALREWLAGRDVVLTNADAWLGRGLDVRAMVEGWDRERVRLLTVDTGRPADFGTLRYCGVALLPGALVAPLRAEPSGLYEVLWRHQWEAGRLDLVVADVDFVDCGTPADYLRANLLASGGASVVDPGAVVGAGAVLDRSVVWDRSVVRAGEHLVDAVRAGRLTVLVR